jgi:hypothetical protein
MKRTALVRKTPMARAKPLSSAIRTSNTIALSAPTLAAKPKMRKCAVCKAPFIKRSMTHKACGPACALVLARQVREKAERKAALVRKEKLKTRSDHMRAAQVAFNAFIRARDAGKTCICCPRPLRAEAVGGGFDCGHYRSVGSAPHLRFDERNAHGQTKQCNRYGAGRAVDYRIGLIARIGLDQVEALEADQAPRMFRAEELIAIKAEYRAKLKTLLGNGDSPKEKLGISSN